MLVRNWMSKPVITIDANASMQDATKLLKEHGVSILPVTKRGALAGVVTDRDLKRASASDASTLEVHELLYLLSKIKVQELMARDPVTVQDDYTIEETAEILMNNKISGAPVLDRGGTLVGVITKNDVFKALISLTGISRRGIQFALRAEDRPGSIKDLTDIMREYGGRMASILSSYERVPKGYRNVYVRMYGVDREKLSEIRQRLGEKALLLYMVDHRENRREIYV